MLHLALSEMALSNKNANLLSFKLFTGVVQVSKEKKLQNKKKTFSPICSHAALQGSASFAMPLGIWYHKLFYVMGT